jgi:hypothetical protein
MIRFLKIKPIDSIDNESLAKQFRSKPLFVDYIPRAIASSTLINHAQYWAA